MSVTGGASPPEPADPLDPEREPDAGFEQLWQRVSDDWDDARAHGAFLEYARLRSLLPQAGARYREVKEREPERRELAEKQLGAVMVLALSMLESTRSTEPLHRTPRWLGALSIFVALALLTFTASRLLGW